MVGYIVVEHGGSFFTFRMYRLLRFEQTQFSVAFIAEQRKDHGEKGERLAVRVVCRLVQADETALLTMDGYGLPLLR